MHLLFFMTIPTFSVHATTYVAQTTIDSLVDRAYYLLTSVDDPGSGMTRPQAILSAKTIAARLRGISENDPNRGYILGKTKELESQIYLEEKGLLLEKEQYTQKNLNDLIGIFNKEIGKPRPSFAQLESYREQMAAIDGLRGKEVEKSIKKRAVVLSREVPASLQAALEKNNIDGARSELVYCEVNRDYFGLTTAGYAALEAKVAARMSDEDEQALVRKALDGLKSALAKNELAVARRENGFIDRRIVSLRSRLVPYEWNRLSSEYALLSRKLNAKEDSLVNSALATLRKNGPAAAEQSLAAMKTAGVSPKRIGQVDRAILETVIKQKRLEPGTDAEFVALADDSGTEAFALGDMIAKAKKRAAEKKDSTAAVVASAARSTQVEEVRKDRLRTAYALQQLRVQDKNKTEKELALQELVDIYTFLELQKSKDAYQKLLYVKTLLKNNIPLEDYDKVTAAVEKQYEKSKEK